LDKSRAVVSRAGLGILTEISALGKAAILIPMPNSHQEDNAAVFAAAKAAVVLSEKDLSTDIFISRVRELIINEKTHNDLCVLIKNFIKSANADLKKIVDNLLS
jgi:UDP-N-acetylglucosamine--N-acetylmuramyl-(pentapeptide) pyrophosphoryl-undecaprenol N-acetylglucosamine transferase